MVPRYGMDEGLGYVAYEAPPARFLDLPAEYTAGSRGSPATQQRIDDAVRAIVMDAFARTTGLLQRRRELLERCARALLASETLDEAALKALTGELKVEPDDAQA
jgi:cell division protease FtsH